jgi:uroporphyrin-III C-methyltransferase
MGVFPTQFPCITLVGAGPGDPDLMTIKGMKAIRSANVVLYDALVSEELLSMVPAGVPILYVGKRCGAHSMRQEEINQLLIASARTYGHAVRLKGGDVFVFGRGGEELLAARAAGISVTVVPGVSSALAVPALAGIPVTHRGVSRGFWVLTATTSGHTLPEEMKQAARANVTVVILMGTRKIREIAALFAAHRGNETPMAVLRAGSLPEASKEVGTAEDFAQAGAGLKTSSPGIIVVGDVVNTLEDGLAAAMQREMV